MRRPDAIEAENAALDEIAALIGQIDTINRLIVHFAADPKTIKRLAPIRRTLLQLKADAQRRREEASKYI